MKTNINKKVVLVWSPSGSPGKTTIAANLAAIAANKGYITAHIELSRYVGSVPSLLLSRMEQGKSIKNAIESNEEREILRCFAQTKYENLFSLSMHPEDTLEDLYSFPLDDIKRVIQVARTNFDMIFLDVPSGYIETGMMAAFESYPDRFIQVLDNNLSSWHALKLCDLLFKQLDTVVIPKPITVINKDEGNITDGMISELGKDMVTIPPINSRIFKIPYVSKMSYYGNEGILVSEGLPGNFALGKIKKTLNALFVIIENDNHGKIKLSL